MVLTEVRELMHVCLQVLMSAGDHAGLIEACARLGDVSRGGDPHLWTEVLQYFGSQQYDCSAQVCEMLPCSPCARAAVTAGNHLRLSGLVWPMLKRQARRQLQAGTRA